MPRSAVLRGRIDARDRAQQRRRHDRRPAAEDAAHDELDSWLDDASLADLSPATVERLDLVRFLRDTGRIALAPAERLRHLAITLEAAFLETAPHAVDRVYVGALRLRPDEAMLWHSRGVSARCAADVSADDDVASRWHRLAGRCLHRAWELDPHDAGIAYSLGTWHYLSGEGAAPAAPWFERALALEPEHGNARLYRAHCLHDQERWLEAVAAYEAVPLAAFEGPRAWLVDVVLEATAHCRLQAGDLAGAESAFERLIERLSREPKRALGLRLSYLEEACRGPLKGALGSEFEALAATLEL